MAANELQTLKVEINTLLSNLGHEVVQGSQTVFNDLPTITFNIGNNRPQLDLDGNILSQEVEVLIDIWADTSTAASSILVEVEEAMREAGYKLNYAADVPNVSDIFHTATRYIAVVC